jgi:hypothetical protein
MARMKKAVAKKVAPSPKPTPPRVSVKVSPSVRVVGAKGNLVNEKLKSGADKAKAENARSIAKAAANKKALKAANKPGPRTKSGAKMKPVPSRGGRLGRLRMGGGGSGGYFNINDMNK